MLLTGTETHVLRFGFQHSQTKELHDLIYLPLSFHFPGYSANGLAKAFGEQLLAAIERNLSLTWYLCPSPKLKTAASIFWLEAAFVNWLEQDLGEGRY